MSIRTVQTVVELFDLPEGAVILTATGAIGEVCEPREQDVPDYARDCDGERDIPRRITWTGSDLYDSERYPEIPPRYFPVRVLYVPGEPDPVVAQLQAALQQALQAAGRYLSQTAGRPNVPTAATKARYARLDGIVAGLKQAVEIASATQPFFLSATVDTLRETPLDS